jgi:UDP-N-acetylmuramoylalanine--D-glutamate ligase
LDHQHDAGVDWFGFTKDSMNETVLPSALPSLVLIVGLGETGVAAARWCVRNGAAVRVADTRLTPAGLEALTRSVEVTALDLHLGCDVFDASLLKGVGALVLSPGLAPGLSPVKELLEQAQAAGIEVIGEIELFARALQQLLVTQQYAPRVLGVTGTNGKTTVTALTRHMLAAAGIRVRAAGNISPAALDSLIDALDTNTLPEVWVLELSSFQLETTRSLRLTAAVVLNITQDHLDWHGNMQAYAQAKARIYDMTDLLLVNRDDAAVMAMCESLSAINVRSFGRDAPMLTGDVGFESSHDVCWLTISEATEFEDDLPAPVRRKKNAPPPERASGRLVRLMPMDALGLHGLHNALNTQVALVLARTVGAGLGAILRAASDYVGEPHRMEFVRSVRGVDFFNDSKGTNVGATVAGLEGLGRRSVLIAGGAGKGQDFSPLVSVVARHVRAVILIGQDGRLLFDTLAPTQVPCLLAETLPQAVELAFAQAQEGDAVVLSPACASLDMFRNYGHRGRVFVDAAHELALSQGEVA